MIVLDEVLKQIEEHRFSNSSEVLAGAVLSACGYPCKAFTLLSASTVLDGHSKNLVVGLMNITQQPDFSNTAQTKAVKRVIELMPHLKGQEKG